MRQTRFPMSIWGVSFGYRCRRGGGVVGGGEKSCLSQSADFNLTSPTCGRRVQQRILAGSGGVEVTVTEQLLAIRDTIRARRFTT